MKHSSQFGGVYSLPGDPGRPLLVGLHGFGMSPGDEWWRWTSFPRRSGLLPELQSRGWSAIFLSAGFARDWNEADAPRVVEAVRAYSTGTKIVGAAHSDGVRGLLSADMFRPGLFSAMICVGGVYKASIQTPPGGPVWFTCGEHDVRAVRESLGPLVLACETAGRLARSTVIPGAKHAWPDAMNSEFLDWAEKG